LTYHQLFFSDLSSGLVTVSSCVTSAVPPHTPATPLTPMMSPCPPVMSQAARPESQTITVTLPVTPLTTGDPMVDQRRHWWHIEEVNLYCTLSIPSPLEMCATHICTVYCTCTHVFVMVGALNSGLSGLGSNRGQEHCVVFLARHLTLTVPLSTLGYKWVPVNIML